MKRFYKILLGILICCFSLSLAAKAMAAEKDDTPETEQASNVNIASEEVQASDLNTTSESNQASGLNIISSEAAWVDWNETEFDFVTTEEDFRKQGGFTLISDDDLLMAGGESTEDTGLYKSQLTGISLQMYEAIENAKPDGIITNSAVVSIDCINDDWDYTFAAYSNLYAEAMYAYVRDHQSSMAWATNSVGLAIDGDDRGVTATLSYDVSPYYSSDLQTSIDAQVNSVVVNKPEGLYNQVKYFHDWLVNTNEYDNAALDTYTYPKGSEKNYYAHSQVGCLVKGTGVCESYAKAFKVFCEKSDITCVIVSSATHAWNYVKMDDGKWYMVDCTFDDPTGGPPVLSYEHFLVSNNPAIDEYHIEDNMLIYPEVADTKYDISQKPYDPAEAKRMLNDTGLRKYTLSGLELRIYEEMEKANFNYRNRSAWFSVEYGNGEYYPQVFLDALSTAYYTYYFDHQSSLVWNPENYLASIDYDGKIVNVELQLSNFNYNSEMQMAVADKESGIVVMAPTNRYEKVKYFHDWLIDNCSVDNNEKTYPHEATPYGCLIEGKGSKNSFAKTFKMFCETANIPCMLVYSFNSVVDRGPMDSHLCNLVKMDDDKWYIIDCVADKYADSYYGDRYVFFLKGIGPTQIHESELIRYIISTEDYVVKPNNVEWSIANHTLKIDGSGALSDFEEHAPWYDMMNVFEYVEIGENVTSIGANAFTDCTNIRTITVKGSDTTFTDVNAFKCDNGTNWLRTKVFIPYKSKAIDWIYENKVPLFAFSDAMKRSYSLSAGGDIGINYIFEFDQLPESELSNCSLVIEKNVQPFMAIDGSNIEVVSDGDSRIIKTTAHVVMKDSDDILTCDMYYKPSVDFKGIKLFETIDYSVDELVAKLARAYPDEKLYRDMFMACIESRLYLGVQTRDTTDMYSGVMLPSGSGYLDNYYEDRNFLLAESGLSAKTVIKSGQVDGVEDTDIVYVGSSLILDHKLTTRHYFKLMNPLVDPSSVITKVNGKTVALNRHSNNLYYVDIAGIAPADYDESFTIDVGPYELEYSVDSYMFDALSGSRSEQLTNMAKALYLYGRSADAYFAR